MKRTLIFWQIAGTALFLSGCCKPIAIPDCNRHIVGQFIEQKADYILPNPAGPTVSYAGGFFAYQFFNSDNNAYQASIEVVGNCDRGSIYLGWMDVTAKMNPKWYHYSYTNCDGKISFRFEPEAINASPPYPYYMSFRRGNSKVRPRPTGAWSEYDDYDAWYIPHWSPILDGNDQLIADIHSYYNEGTAADVTALLNKAKPANGEDLEDRTLTGWETTPMRGVVTRASHPYGDLDIDHLKGCKETYGGIPEEIKYPEKGADWDMYIQPDPDMGYLATDVKPNEVGCEIEDWTLFDDARYFRPKAGDYLQTAGRWVTDCGHPIFYDLQNGFFTEIHPPEYLVSSRFINGTTHARILGTGAFKDAQQSFFIWPGPRPSPYHKLKWRVDNVHRQNMQMNISAVPARNPNHLVGTLTRTDGDGLKLDDAGVVYQRCNVLYHGQVFVWWEFESPVDKAIARDLGIRITGVDPNRLHPEKMVRLIDSGGAMEVPGEADELPHEMYAVVRYRPSEPDSLTGDWKEAVIQNGHFVLNLRAGQSYHIAPVSPFGVFHPRELTFKLDESRINDPEPIRLHFVPHDVNAGPRYSLMELGREHTGDNPALNGLLGKIIAEPEPGGIRGLLLLNQPVDPAGQALPPEAVRLSVATLGDSVALRDVAAQLLGNTGSQDSLLYFEGKFMPAPAGTAVRLRFFRGTDTTGYWLQYEMQAVLESDGRMDLAYQPVYGYFGGRIAVWLEGQEEGTARYGFVSPWVESLATDHPNSGPGDALRFESAEAPEMENEAAEFQTYHRLLHNSTNPHLFKATVRRTSEVKGRH